MVRHTVQHHFYQGAKMAWIDVFAEEAETLRVSLCKSGPFQWLMCTSYMHAVKRHSHFIKIVKLK